MLLGINITEEVREHLRLSWFGRIAAVKMKLLPKLLFLLRPLALQIPKKAMIEIQGIINTVVWAGQKTRIKAAFLQQRKKQGGVSLSNIEYYYQAAMLEHVLQW